MGRRLARAALDLLLPPRCPVCREIAGGDGRYCAACWAGLTFITAPLCARCGTPFDIDRGANAMCGACLMAPPRFTAARAAMAYDGSARTVLLGFKHGDRQYLARVMAPQLVRAGAGWLGPGALLVPVPLHRWRLWGRGYNQAALIAGALARLSGAAVRSDLLLRPRATPVLRGLGRRGRAKAVAGAFALSKDARAVLKGRHVVLVDDVFTSGATAAACTRLLLRGGAARVTVLCWARVIGEGADD